MMMTMLLSVQSMSGQHVSITLLLWSHHLTRVSSTLSCFSVCLALAFATRPKAQEVKLYTSRLVHHTGDSTAVEVEDVPGVRRWDMARDSAAMVQLMKPF